MTTLNLSNVDGNAFSVLGAATAAAKKAGWSKTEIGAYLAEAKSGDYSNLLAVTMDYFEVTLGDIDIDADSEVCDECGDTMLFCTCGDGYVDSDICDDDDI